MFVDIMDMSSREFVHVLPDLQHTPRPHAKRSAAMRPGAPRAFVVRLIDRRVGSGHSVNGAPLMMLTPHPVEAAATLLAGRDPAVWEVRTDQIDPQVRG